MRWLSTTRRSPIGLDLGDEHIKAVQLVRQGGPWRLAAATCFHRQHPAEDHQAAGMARIRAVLHRQGFTGNRLVMMLPAEALKTAPLELPPANQSVSAGQVAQMEFARIHQWSPGSFEMAWWPVQAPARSREMTHVLAVGCRHDDALGLLESLREENLTVERLVPHVHALAEVFRRLDADRTGVAVMLDLGWTAARLIVLFQGVAVYDRQIAELGIHVVHDNLSRHLGVDNQEIDQLLSSESTADQPPPDWSQPLIHNSLQRYLGQLQSEIQMALSYAAHRYPESPIGRLWMLGGGAGLGAIREHLQHTVGMEICCAVPEQMLSACDAVKTLAASPQLTLASVLALMEVA